MRKKIVAVIVLILAIIIGYLGFNYFKISSLEQDVENQFSIVESKLSRYYENIFNFSNLVEEIVPDEKLVNTVTESIKNNLKKANTINEKVKKDNKLENDLVRLMVIKDSYTDIELNEQVNAIAKDLVDVQESLHTQKENYNKKTISYNDFITKFPTNITAKLFGFEKHSLFKFITTNK